MALSRRSLIGALAAPAILSAAARAEGASKVKIAAAANTTANACFLMGKYLKEDGVESEVTLFPSILQRMQAVASGDVQVGSGGLSATMQVDVKGVPMVVLANGCDGGWTLIANPKITSFAELRGKKIAVQNGSIALAGLLWKIRHEGMEGAVELIMMDGDKQPIPLYRGDVDAICGFEPFPTFAAMNGWGKQIWSPYDTPMGKTNLGFVSSLAFVQRQPELTRKLVRAHVLATKEIIDHPEIALETTMKQFNMTRPVAEASNVNLFFSTESGPAFQAGVKATAKMMIDSKLMDAEPNWSSFINTSFLPA